MSDPSDIVARDGELIARFAARLDCDAATVVHAALLCLSGELHGFRGLAVRFAYLDPRSLRPDGPRPEGHVEDLVRSYREELLGGTPPPPIHVVGRLARNGNHRLHAAQRLGLARIPAFVVPTHASRPTASSSARDWLKKQNPAALARLDRAERARQQRKSARPRP